MTSPIPTADEMTNRTQSALDQISTAFLERIADAIFNSVGFSIIMNITEEEEKIVNIAMVKLKGLGYGVDFTAGYFEDRPCGGWLEGKLNISWEHRSKG